MVPQVQNPNIILSHENLKNELGKFFSVAKNFSQSGKPAFMPSCMVDQKWHDLLGQVNTKEYVDLSKKTYGKVPVHVQSNGFGVIEWVKDYEKSYGKLNQSWFYDADGNFNQELYNNYHKTGVLKCAWDCNPA